MVDLRAKHTLPCSPSQKNKAALQLSTSTFHLLPQTSLQISLSLSLSPLRFSSAMHIDGSGAESCKNIRFSQPIKPFSQVGSLPFFHNFTALREVPNEVYKSLDAVGEGENWWEAVELQKLILAHNNIESLKEDIRNLPLLTVLNVSHNKLSHLPAAIGELHMLKSLDVSFNMIASIPEEVGSATSLVKFDCSNNQLKDLPGSLGRCLELSDLKTSNNCIISLPEDLVNCSKLTKLDVEGNKLTSLSENVIASCIMLTELNASKNMLSGIPQSIGSLSHLIRLDLHQNRISSIPSSIMGCSSLVEFYMGNNMLSSLPAEIGALPHLGTFDLHSNKLKEYHAEACKLRLSVLDLSNNSLSGLPPEIGMMTTLRKILLVGNPLRSLRSSLVNGPTPALLQYLRSRLPVNEESAAGTPSNEDVIARAARMSLTSKELSLVGLGFSAVPSEVWESSEVTKLDLSKNSIEELPVEFSSCVSLELDIGTLNFIHGSPRRRPGRSGSSVVNDRLFEIDHMQTLILSRNKMKEWPGAILKSLSNLSCLKLDNNPLRQIPSDGFQAAPKLQILDLSGNASCLPEHPAFSSLPQLQELYLRRIHISEFPSALLQLQQLRLLDLSQNSLQLIPKGIKNMTSLTELDLSDNNITTLPAELGLLEPSLQVLKLDGNPLRSIRRAILDRGTKAVLNYLKDKIVDN
ncbi:hypothetical protein RHSIM_Rhsim06G0196800 [Rhododendron simsii]|uniref:Uncharacterized protein n=1 Tax=Rhododendron simsii TaxID=118357 RepID=A0A834LNF0_RHOSS|nr:hypothetical protein RHSIM_Rhsim06G0196800 [Rhododendron simsii]